MTESPSLVVLADDVDEGVGVEAALLRPDADHHRGAEDAVLQPHFPVVLPAVQSAKGKYREMFSYLHCDMFLVATKRLYTDVSVRPSVGNG